MKQIFLIILIFILASSAASAAGVLLYDSANNKFVIKGSLSIDDKENFKMNFTSLNPLSNTNLFLNSRQNLLLSFGQNNATTGKFIVKNFENKKVLEIDNSANLKIGSNVDLAANTIFSVSGTGAVTKVGGISAFGIINSSGGITATGLATLPTLTSSGNSVFTSLNSTDATLGSVTIGAGYDISLTGNDSRLVAREICLPNSSNCRTTWPSATYATPTHTHDIAYDRNNRDFETETFVAGDNIDYLHTGVLTDCGAGEYLSGIIFSDWHGDNVGRFSIYCKKWPTNVGTPQ